MGNAVTIARFDMAICSAVEVLSIDIDLNVYGAYTENGLFWIVGSAIKGLVSMKIWTEKLNRALPSYHEVQSLKFIAWVNNFTILTWTIP